MTVDDGALTATDGGAHRQSSTAGQPTASSQRGARWRSHYRQTPQLNGTATDSGLPTPANLVTTWSVVSGPGTVSFGDAQALQTSATFSDSGTYTLRLTADDNALTATDDLVIAVGTAGGYNISISAPALTAKVGTLAFRDEDILAYNPASDLWSLVLDGSDVGLGQSDIDAFTIFSRWHLFTKC
ncbi:MAG: hypothetical protein R2867_39845 [Caldilineaceae bacterium]